MRKGAGMVRYGRHASVITDTLNARKFRLRFTSSVRLRVRRELRTHGTYRYELPCGTVGHAHGPDAGADRTLASRCGRHVPDLVPVGRAAQELPLDPTRHLRSRLTDRGGHVRCRVQGFVSR